MRAKSSSFTETTGVDVRSRNGAAGGTTDAGMGTGASGANSRLTTGLLR